MYEICKKQYQRKMERGLLTSEYAEKQKIYIGIFLMNELLTQEQYEEVLELLIVKVEKPTETKPNEVKPSETSNTTVNQAPQDTTTNVAQ